MIEIIEDSGVIIQLFVAVISLICSILTLLIIKLMNKWNGYLLLVVNLTISQIIYDISILMIPCPNNSSSLLIEKFLRFYSGLAATLWSNVILFVVVYVVYYYQTIDTKKRSILLIFSINILSILISIIQLAFPFITLYYWLRIASIGLNILFYFVILIKLNEIFGYRSGSKSNNENNRPKAMKQDPIQILAYRLKYYPIVQIFCRAGVSWYEYITNTSGFDYNYNSNASLQTQIAFFVYSITQPSAGIGFFIIFCYVSPGAYQLLKNIICYKTSNIQNNVIDTNRLTTDANIGGIDETINNPIISPSTTITDFNSNMIDIRESIDSKMFQLPQTYIRDSGLSIGSNIDRLSTDEIDYTNLDDDELAYIINHNHSKHTYI